MASHESSLELGGAGHVALYSTTKEYFLGVIIPDTRVSRHHKVQFRKIKFALIDAFYVIELGKKRDYGLPLKGRLWIRKWRKLLRI